MRPRRRQLAAFAVLCIAVLGISWGRWTRRPKLDVSVAVSSLEADGASETILTVRGDLDSLRITSSDPSRLRVDSMERTGGKVIARLRAGVVPGDVRVRVADGNRARRELSMTLQPSKADTFGDGTPDFLRLNDEADVDVFRRWLGFLAESQFFLQPKLAPDVIDCASLVRFAYREALRQHDREWAAAKALPRLPAIQELQQYHYPYTPLGASLFRTRPGPFVPEDLRNGVFAEFADAKTLRNFSAHLISRRVKDARTGDLLFFLQDSQRSPFHVMVYLERSALDSIAEPLVVYHTGPIHDTPGEVRRPTLEQLMHYPDARWRPLPENRAFLGVYRWNILRGTN